MFAINCECFKTFPSVLPAKDVVKLLYINRINFLLFYEYALFANPLKNIMWFICDKRTIISFKMSLKCYLRKVKGKKKKAKER